MISYNNIFLLSFFCFVLHGCASAYKPNNTVLTMSRSMSKAEAINVVKSTLVSTDPKLGICQANGIPDGGFLNNGWEVDVKKPELKANPSGISFNAFRKMLRHTSSGNIATQGIAGLSTTTTTTLAPIRRSINYAEFETATIYYQLNTMNMVCYIKEGYAEVRISLSTGMGHWISILISNNNLEKFIAATMIVAPQTKFQTN